MILFHALLKALVKAQLGDEDDQSHRANGGERWQVAKVVGVHPPTRQLLGAQVAADVLSQVVAAHKAAVAHRASKALLASVCASMAGQLIRAGESSFAALPVADEWLLTCGSYGLREKENDRALRHLVSCKNQGWTQWCLLTGCRRGHDSSGRRMSGAGDRHFRTYCGLCGESRGRHSASRATNRFPEIISSSHVLSG
ncbi:hypothetical protein JZ751_000357 [Albula glossodonta]|uniref:Uncharacterized protein n=1 Tax=Albula glossodonta TaxID=121402 RepID=A0A8T2PVW9_9TELE|nr:hypothetical protein JZ751_000357 [Albula glossodonta]